MLNGMTIFGPFVVTMEVGFLVIVQYLTILLSLGFRSKSLDVGPKSGFDVQGHGLTGWLGALRITDRDWSTAQLTAHQLSRCRAGERDPQHNH